jgi:hypothetical protein
MESFFPEEEKATITIFNLVEPIAWSSVRFLETIAVQDNVKIQIWVERNENNLIAMLRMLRLVIHKKVKTKAFSKIKPFVIEVLLSFSVTLRKER